MEHLTLLVHLTDNADEMQFANLLSIYNTKCTLLSAAYAMLTVAFTKKKNLAIMNISINKNGQRSIAHS